MLHVVFPRARARAIPLDAETVQLFSGEIEISYAGEQHTLRRVKTASRVSVDGSPVQRRAVVLADQSVVRVGETVMIYEHATPEEQLDEATDALPGPSRAMYLLRTQLDRVARSDAPVLISGETGTGKARVAREIHRASVRSGAFVPVHCTELAPHTFPNQLLGLLRSAERGTLFLDEIGELDLDLQPRLLRALDEREARPYGEVESQRIDVRFIASTNTDLAGAVERGRFRRDLLARLAMFELRVPALRERKRDLLEWIGRIDPALVYDADTVELLLLQRLESNIRDLQRLSHHLRSVDRQRIAVDDFRDLFARTGRRKGARGGERKPAPPSRDELQRLLATHGGSVRAVATHLKRDRKQIYRWMRAYAIQR